MGQKNLSYTLDPEIRWISNQKYILNKLDKENNTNIERSSNEVDF